MRYAFAVLTVALLALFVPAPAAAQWIPPLAPGGAALGPDPQFPGIATPPSAGTATAVTPPVSAVTAPLKAAAAALSGPPVIPDSTLVWLTYYGSPLSPYFVPRPPAPNVPGAGRPE